MKQTFLLTVVILLLTVRMFAQSVAPATLNAAGKTMLAGGNEFDWSVGEMTLVNTFTSASIIVTQGVLQPYEMRTTGIGVNSGLATQVQVFPNPAISELTLLYTCGHPGTLNYRMMDMAGKVVSRKSLDVTPEAGSEKINLSGLVSGSYILEIVVNTNNGAQESFSYTIQKSQ